MIVDFDFKGPMIKAIPFAYLVIKQSMLSKDYPNQIFESIKYLVQVDFVPY